MAMAGDPNCPTCLVVDWGLNPPHLDLTGPGLGANVVAAVLILEDAYATCELDLPPSTVGGELPWNLELDYANECGTALEGSEIHVDRGQGLELEAVLAD